MKYYIKKYLIFLPFFITLFLCVVWMLFFYQGTTVRLFVTADQLGYQHFQNKVYNQAASTFSNASFRAASYYKAGEFKKAQALYANLEGKEGKYNHGNTLVMLGEYDGAIQAYELALQMDPNFIAAKENLLIAKARNILKHPDNDGEQGVGELGADEIVFDNTQNKGVDDDQSAQKEAADGNPNWLNRLQTGPKAFLKNKFSYQYQSQTQIKSTEP